ncbi:MAG: 50S ribosomal protein L9 [Chloroflexi bacterium]|nr:50S ribosomal protein L9 [Chloroflexota bacterium]
MRIIFLSDVPGSGLAGEVKEVKNGYARNYLLPKKLATVATHDQIQRLDAIRRAGEARRLKEEEDMKSLASMLAETPVNLTARVGPTGKFYGAVTSSHIAEELNRLTQRDFDRRLIHLEKPIQEPGEYKVELRFPQGLSATVSVVVQGHDAAARAAAQVRAETKDAQAQEPTPAPKESSASLEGSTPLPATEAPEASA